MAAPHILIVDDEPGITRLCERLLKRLDYQVTSFTDPEAAMKYVVQNKIDLLLVDIRMPQISGFDLIATPLDSMQPSLGPSLWRDPRVRIFVAAWLAARCTGSNARVWTA